jgi:hypothetical protein
MTPISRLAVAALFALPFAAPAAAQSVVPLGAFKSVQLRGGGHVVLRHGAVQRVTLIKGSTQYTGFELRHGDELVIDACNASCPQHYDLEIDIVSPDIEGVGIAGGGAIESSGAFPRQDRIAAAVKGGGSIDIRSLPAASADAAVSGGGRIRIMAERELNAAVNGGGKITYWGNPQVNSAINGGGSVSKGNDG